MKEFDLILFNSIILAYWKYIQTWEWTAEFYYLDKTIRFRIYKDLYNGNKINVSTWVSLRNININKRIISWIFEDLRSDIINNLDKYKKIDN